MVLDNVITESVSFYEGSCGGVNRYVISTAGTLGCDFIVLDTRWGRERLCSDGIAGIGYHYPSGVIKWVMAMLLCFIL